MIFLLTGDIQIGKTRWLLKLQDEFAARGTVCSGVIAPGDWVRDAQGGFEKRGIDNLLLPDRRRITFARRRDLALADGTFDCESASAKAGLMWEISESALDEVNAHFARLAAGNGEGGAFGHADAPELLIVDEFGQLELKRGQGLTAALALVDAGQPAGGTFEGASKHCLVVVRECLLPLALERFSGRWGETRVISPNDEARDLIMQTLLP